MGRKPGEILRLFTDSGDFVSGEAISRELKISRTAVWKQINLLRKAGYGIEAVPSRGYRLTAKPDLLSADEIGAALADARRIGRRLACKTETVSTNADAYKLAENGAEEGTVVMADAQSGGRGRLGRTWCSPAGLNLYCSVILRPPVAPYQAPQLTFLSSVAVAAAIEQVTGLAPEIKWPNDVLIKGRKIAGLLNEMSAETDLVNFVILGIGVNINMPPECFPPDLRTPATSLAIELGRPVRRSAFAAAMLAELDRLYAEFLAQGFDPVRSEWQRRCNARGRDLVVSDGGVDQERGRFAGIDGDGALLLERPDGMVKRIMSGDVRIV